MGKLQELLKYTPPDFSLFEKYGGGFLSEARDATNDAFSTLVDIRAMDEDKFVAWGKKERIGTSGEDLVDLYGQWTMADDMLKRLEYMDPAERAKHLTLGPLKQLLDYEKTLQKFTDMTVEIRAWEKEDGVRLIYPALDHQLKRRLDAWEHYLSDAEYVDELGKDFTGDEERVYGIDSFCRERSLIEYAAMGIQNLRFREPGRFEPLPYLKTFINRRLELDKVFRKALKGRYCFSPWADPAFWWHWPPNTQKKQKTK
jgi:hypothetical protein